MKLLNPAERAALEKQLLTALVAHTPALNQRMIDNEGHWSEEDYFYRYYHTSWKVFGLQAETLATVAVLRALLPDVPLNKTFEAILAAGTGKVFNNATNAEWDAQTLPILQAFSHASYFLRMAVKYAGNFQEPPSPLPSGYAALLYLFNLR